MKRALAILGAVLLLGVIFAPAVLAQDGMAHTERVIISTGGDFELPAGEQADVVIVVDGDATIYGDVKTVVTIDGAATIVGARAESIVAIRSTVTLGEGTVVTGDVWRLDAQVHQLGNATVGGGLRDLGAELIGLTVVAAPVLLVMWLGLAIAMIAAGLLAAALAARQLRAAGALISREPVKVVLAAIGGTFLPILVIVGLFITILGAPLAFGILVFLWPLAAFLGYLVAGVWIGDWILGRITPGVVRERPYLAATIGIALLQLIAFWPLLHFVPGFVGYGAVLLLAWRTWESGRPAASPYAGPRPLPVAG